MSMRIVKNGDVHVSAPVCISRKEIENFISEHQGWIEEARKRNNERLRRRAGFYARLPQSTKAQKEDAARKLSALVEPMILKHSEAMGVSPSAISYRPMISRWGVCKVKERSICFSTYLLLLPDLCIEHVVVHELCHLLEPSHNARFHRLMDNYFPQWRKARLCV